MMMGFGLIWIVVLIGVGAYLLGWRPGDSNRGQPARREEQQSALDVLQERYARGEVNREEFYKMREDLAR